MSRPIESRKRARPDRRGPRPDHHVRGRYVQLGLVFLLGFCVAQTAWWMLDQWQYTARVRARIAVHLEAERRAAGQMLDTGLSPTEIEKLFPVLIVDDAADDENAVRVDPRVWQAIENERFHRLNQYGWEGGFFVVVLIATMTILARALREEARLRRRQQGFLATISHELRGRIASIRLAAETLSMPAGQNPEARERQIDRVVGNVDRLDRMVANLLDTVRLEEGEVRLRPDDVELLPLVRQVVADATDRAERTGAHLVVDVADGLILRADPTAVETVLRNLVHNAIDATRGTADGVVRIDASTGARTVRVRVNDNGRGFEPALARTLFEMFYRPSDAPGRGARGSGLGLYIVDQLMEMSGGRATASSEGPGNGAVFTTSWPASGGAA